ncbi:hypothetical protein ACIP6T_24480 [Pantoea sp. NPDC088449]|uniref:hypothetical protein n=1 Tax=Pantoea sp. NPDC088449 TaxID=3364392 RepID=UPI0038116761
MAKIEVLQHALFNIDIDGNSVTRADLAGEKKDFAEFSNIMLTEILENEKSKQYEFTDNKELVASHIQSFIKNDKINIDDTQDLDWEKRTESIALKLLKEEISAQEKIAAMDKKIKKGSLLLLLIEEDEIFRFVILKIDFDSFFDEIEARIRRGLPMNKNRLQKSCLITLSSDGEFESILISDSGRTIREYWWSGFLSTRELQSSELNTKNSYDAIDNVLRREVKKDYPSDYVYIRNDVNAYFRNNDNFSFPELIGKIEKHKSDHSDLQDKLPSIIAKLKVLPVNPRAPFDTQFDLSISVIKNRIRSVIFLDDQIELRIKADVPNLKHKIKAEKDDDGKYIKIYTDKGYEIFGGKEE